MSERESGQAATSGQAAEFEQSVERLMKQDFAAGTATFRDNLLARCLDVLGEDAPAWNATGNIAEHAGDDEPRELSDSALELLAAAGPPYVNGFADTDLGAFPS